MIKLQENAFVSDDDDEEEVEPRLAHHEFDRIIFSWTNFPNFSALSACLLRVYERWLIKDISPFNEESSVRPSAHPPSRYMLYMWITKVIYTLAQNRTPFLVLLVRRCAYEHVYKKGRKKKQNERRLVGGLITFRKIKCKIGTREYSALSCVHLFGNRATHIISGSEHNVYTLLL